MYESLRLHGRYRVVRYLKLLTTCASCEMATLSSTTSPPRREVRPDDDDRRGGSEPLDARVAETLNRQCGEAEAEREPDVGRLR